MRNYAPRYFLINGKAYPDTDPIPCAAGQQGPAALRERRHPAPLHGDAGPAPDLRRQGRQPAPGATHDVVAESLAPGQTADAIATVPASATTGSRFALYDGSLMLHNNGAPASAACSPS